MKKMDIKYRDSLPNVIRDLPMETSDNEMTGRVGKRKRKSSKKMGKNGLYPEEDQFVAKWWINRNVSTVPGESAQQELKRLVADLRLRETQLQILLILETIALEASTGKTTETSTTGTREPQAPKKTKGRKGQDLDVQLELLADRLCIWHTVSFDEILPLDNSTNKEKHRQAEKEPANDKLRDFCTEVIMPFYAARLPEQCKTLCRKFGAPIAASPVRTAPKSETTSHKSKRTFQRVLTEQKSRSKGKVPALPRSNTTPTAPEMKREGSEPVSLSQLMAGRGGIQKPKRIDNREIDLDAASKQHETKLKKMNTLLEQKRELDAAIHALRKPNRELVAKDFAETVEQRTNAKSSRKPKNPVRNPFAQGVQVMATPKRQRKKDYDVAGLPSLPQNWKSTPSLPIGSDPQVIPSSTSRPVRGHESESTGSSSRRALDSINETPSKPSSYLTNGIFNTSQRNSKNNFIRPSLPTHKPELAFDTSPTLTRKSKSLSHLNRREGDGAPAESLSRVEDTPPKPRSTFAAPGAGTNSLPDNDVFTTPIKRQAPKPDFSETNRHQNDVISATPEKSIYDHLGWNDDDDELALP